MFPLDRGWQKHWVAEEKGRGAKWRLGEDGEPIGEQWHWWRHCAHSSTVQADPEPVCWGKCNWGHYLLPGRGPPQGRHRPGGFSQGGHFNTTTNYCISNTDIRALKSSLILILVDSFSLLFQHVRLLSRKQFQLRALMQKARKTAGLSDLYWPTLTTWKHSYLHALWLYC